MTAYALGDSITRGKLATPFPAAGAVGLLEAQLGIAVQMLAKDGDTAEGQSNVAFGIFPADGDQIIVGPGCNDMKTFKSDAAKQAFFAKFERHMIAWCGSPQKLVARTSADLAFTGSWVNTPVNAVSKYTTQQGAKVSGVVRGTAVLVGYMVQNSTATDSTAEVRVDGNLVGTLQGYAPISQYGAACEVFDGLADGDHQVEVAVTSSGKNFHFAYMLGAPQVAKPKIFVWDILPLTDACYASNHISIADALAYNALIDQEIARCAALGFDVVGVRTRSRIDPSVDLNQSDGTHPLNSGHQKRFEDLLAAWQGAVEPPPPPEETVCTLVKVGNDFFADDGAARTKLAVAP